MLLIQILILAFVFFALSRAIVRFREGALSRGWLAFWLAVWTVVAVAAALPQTTTGLARVLGVGRGVDAVIYVAIVFLFYIVFRIFLRLEKVEHDITLIVRDAALRDRPNRREVPKQ